MSQWSNHSLQLWKPKVSKSVLTVLQHHMLLTGEAGQRIPTAFILPSLLVQTTVAILGTTIWPRGKSTIKVEAGWTEEMNFSITVQNGELTYLLAGFKMRSWNSKPPARARKFYQTGCLCRVPRFVWKQEGQICWDTLSAHKNVLAPVAHSTVWPALVSLQRNIYASKARLSRPQTSHRYRHYPLRHRAISSADSLLDFPTLKEMRN